MANYKQLCAELVAVEDALMDGATLASNQGQALDGYSALASFRSLANRARAALAEPEDEELLCIAAESIDGYNTCGIKPGRVQAVRAYGSELCDFARAVLARWGSHHHSLFANAE